MEAFTIQLRVKLPESIKTELLGCNLNPVVVLSDIRKSLKDSLLETPPPSPKNDDPEKVQKSSITTKGALQKAPSGSKSPGGVQRLKSVKRKRETWDPSAEYEVEKILGYHRDERNRMLYLVKWKRWASEHNTFEPISNLTGCHYKLMRYFESEEPTKAEMMRKSRKLEMGLRRRKIFQKLQQEDCGAEALEEFSRICPQAQELLSGGNLKDLERRISAEYGYIVRCLIAMYNHQDQGLILRGQDYCLLLKLIRMRLTQLRSNANSEKAINAVESAKVTIENRVDLQHFPDLEYIVDLKPGAGVVLSKDPLLGCECPDGCSVKSRCCGKMADSKFAYGHNGRLRTSEKIAIYECNCRCRCPPSCPNRVVQRGRQVELCIFKTRSCGWGVKAMEDIPKGTFVCEYIGEVIPEEEANARDRECAAENKSSYLFNLDFFTDSGLPMYCIDAAKQGNVARFINHSCDPNLVVYPVWVNWIEPNFHRLAFFARKNIQKGEEIQFDYENLSEEKSEGVTASDRLRCQCNAANCREWVFMNR